MEPRKTARCSACGRKLDPNTESVIYIGQSPHSDLESEAGRYAIVLCQPVAPFQA
jgi:hypothetical protein